MFVVFVLGTPSLPANPPGVPHGPAPLESAAISAGSGRVSHRLALSNIEKFLASGKGIVVYHLAIGIFETRKERVESIIGRVYDRALPGHDPFRGFREFVTLLRNAVLWLARRKVPGEPARLSHRPNQSMKEDNPRSFRRSVPISNFAVGGAD